MRFEIGVEAGGSDEARVYAFVNEAMNAGAEGVESVEIIERRETFTWMTFEAPSIESYDAIMRARRMTANAARIG